MPRDFVDALTNGRFLVTTEETPPKGADLTGFRRRVEPLVRVVDAVNVTDSSSAVMTMSPLATVPVLLELGLVPIVQLTCRDRNRLALQSDLLAAAALGARAVVCMTGDPMSSGDDLESPSVLDLTSVELLQAVARLNGGYDLGGNALSGAPNLCPGAVVNPGAADLEREVAWTEQKASAGALFFQTQAVYEPAAFERFVRRIDRLGVPVLAGFIVLKSGAMARRLNRSLPGVSVPEALIRQLDRAEDRPAASLEISARVIRELVPMCRGLHLIAVGWESRIAEILAAAGLPGLRD